MRAFQIFLDGTHQATAGDKDLDELSIWLSITPKNEEPHLIVQGRKLDADTLYEFQWVDLPVGVGSVISLKHVESENIDQPSQTLETKIESRCSFCGKTEEEVGELKRGKYAIAKICGTCLQLLAAS